MSADMVAAAAEALGAQGAQPLLSSGKVCRLREEVASVRNLIEESKVGKSSDMVQVLQKGLHTARTIVAEQLSAFSALLDSLSDQAAACKAHMEERDFQIHELKEVDSRLRSDHIQLQEAVSKLEDENDDLKGKLHEAQRTIEHPELRRRSKSEPLDRLTEKAGDPPKRDSLHDDSMSLPVKLRGFTTLMEMNGVQQLSKAPELSQAERALQMQPDSLEAASNLQVLLLALSQRLQQNIDTKLHEENVQSSCIEVVQAGNVEFLEIYNSVWRLISNNEEPGLAAYRAAVKTAVCSGEAIQQRAGDVVSLYTDAAKTKLMHDPLIRNLLGAGSLGFTAEVSIPQDLKRTARVLEKCLMRADAPGNPDRVADIVRAMVIATSMQELAAIVLKLIQCRDIVLVRVKERFENAPTSGGWRDCAMNYYLREDPAKHICEIQLAHKTMLTARKGLPGHVIYNRVRNASEILEVLGNCQAFGLSILDAKHAGLSVSDCRAANFSANECKRAGWTAEDCRRAGFSPIECKKAGFAAYDFWKAGFTLADCKDADLDLKSCSYAGYSFDQCKQIGFSAFECKRAGASAGECRQGGYTAAECRDAGYNATQCKKAGFSEKDMYLAGFSLRDCIDEAGSSALECRKAGFSCLEFKNAGMTVAVCAAAGFNLADLHMAGFSVSACKIAGYSLAACLRAGFLSPACRGAGFTAEQYCQEGMTTSDLREAGFSTADCKRVGCSVYDCKKAGYNAEECRSGGFSPADSKSAGFTAADFKSAGLSAAHCREAGFTAQDCKAIFLAADLREAGYSAAQCHAAGFARKACLTAGFTEAECDEAGM